MIFISVDLPAPFSPTSPCTSPRRRVKSTPVSAVTPPNVLPIPDSSRIGGRPLGGVPLAQRSGSDQEVLLHPEHAVARWAW